MEDDVFQIYFLSILCNALTGIVLMFASKAGNLAEENSSESKTNHCFSSISPNVRLILGLATLGVGFLKFIVIVNDSLLILSDLIPALCGLLAGFTLLFQYFVSATLLTSSLNEKYKNFFIGGQKYIGIVCILVAVLHFLFPGFFLL